MAIGLAFHLNQMLVFEKGFGWAGDVSIRQIVTRHSIVASSNNMGVISWMNSSVVLAD